MTEYLDKFLEWRRSLDLPSPGSYEQLHRDARNVSLTSMAFEGGKADLAKTLSANFQVAHSFTLGSLMQPSSYHFAAVYAQGKHLMHGMIDTSGNFQGKYNYTFPMGLTTKVQTMISSQQPGQSMIQFEGDWTAPSTSASASASGLTTGPASALGTAPSSAASTWSGTSINVKAINPDPSAGTGILTASLLQSVSKQLALGGEMILQRSADSPNLEQGLNLAARFTPTPKSTLTATLQQFVALQTSYHHRVSDKVELASELQLLLVGPRRDAVTSVGAKFEYRQATIRAQVDSTGRVGLLLEEKLFPGFSLLLSGELDHVRGASRFGIGLTMEN